MDTEAHKLLAVTSIRRLLALRHGAHGSDARIAIRAWIGDLRALEPAGMHCDQCELVSINGVACHERGCVHAGNPNNRNSLPSRWDTETLEWVRQYKCSDCEDAHDDGEGCSFFGEI